MRLHELKVSARFPVDLERGWAFFSDPRNLRKLTPEKYRLTILSELPEKTVKDLKIRYSLRVFRIIPQSWETLISEVEAPNFFIDEALSGPYKVWRHEHRLLEIENGIEVQDHVQYAMPFGPFGEVLHSLFVRQELDNLFAYRAERLRELLGEMPG